MWEAPGTAESGTADVRQVEGGKADERCVLRGKRVAKLHTRELRTGKGSGIGLPVQLVEARVVTTWARVTASSTPSDLPPRPGLQTLS